MNPLYLIVPFAPLFGSIVAGFFGKKIGRTGAHSVTILGVFISLIASVIVFSEVMAGNTFDGTLYHWSIVGTTVFEVGFLIDTLTATMMLVVTSVSLMVHIYTIGYMKEDPGYQRFFCYISLFTFSMLMLVMSNNFLQLFFGWEAVGLVSYLLIGFYYDKPSAIHANLKAFLVNRVGDFGFILGIGLLLAYGGSLNYAEVFAEADVLANKTLPGLGWPLLAVACICLFIGAMGKSAQFPLHVWLPDSMEGPTPISALIHAATMVTAGIFLVSRMSPLFELSDIALNFILIIGSITALFMGFLGIVQNDIKRVVAYSTLSQLGYMTVALGVSAYPVAIFHLMTHAFFKALLFLGAGSVIMGMHHNQDMRYMGGLWKRMPITWITTLIGSLALIGFPFFSGFYSKDSIILAVQGSELAAAGFAQFVVYAGVFVTALYTFRMYFMVFHGKERFHELQHDSHGDDDHHHAHHGPIVPHESPWVVTVPLILLAIPSVVIGFIAIEPMLFGNYFDGVITTIAAHGGMAALTDYFNGTVEMAFHGFVTLPFWLAVLGVASAAVCYLYKPAIPAMIQKKTNPVFTLLVNKYYLDKFNEIVFAGGARGIGQFFWQVTDKMLIDGLIVNGSARIVGIVSSFVRFAQTGFIYHYAFAMIVGVLAMIIAFVTLKY